MARATGVSSSDGLSKRDQSTEFDRANETAVVNDPQPFGDRQPQALKEEKSDDVKPSFHATENDMARMPLRGRYAAPRVNRSEPGESRSP